LSTLTKIFVGLLVVTSLLLSAAAMTFVYTTPDYANQLESLQAKMRVAESRANQAQSEASKSATASANEATALRAALAAARTRVTELQAEVANANADVASAELASQQALAAQTVAMTAVTQTQASNDTLQQQVIDTRDELEKTVGLQTQTATKLAETQNNLVYANRALRRSEEKNVELLGKIEQANAIILALGGNPTDPDSNPAAPPAINGVILAKDVVEGVPYAMISVGSEDDVEPGMEFIILDGRTSDFLGFINIEQVDDTQAFGRLTGNTVEQIKTNDVVRTKLLGS